MPSHFDYHPVSLTLLAASCFSKLDDGDSSRGVSDRQPGGEGRNTSHDNWVAADWVVFDLCVRVYESGVNFSPFTERFRIFPFVATFFRAHCVALPFFSLTLLEPAG